MKKKNISMLAALAIAGNILFMPHIAKAETNIAAVMVEEALKEKTFYHYNMAYFEIMKLQDENQKAELSNKLVTIADTVWSKEIKDLNAVLHDMVKTASGRTYDELEAKIKNSGVVQIDKEYLLGELTSWGRKLVWTPDYLAGVDAIIKAWTSNTEESIIKAEEVLNKIGNSYSREYLQEELAGAKNKYYNNEATFITKLNNIKANLNEENILVEAEKIKSLLKNTTLVNVPEQYTSTDIYYVLLTLIVQFDLPDTIPALQTRLNEYVTAAEAGKLKGNSNVPADMPEVENIVLKANTGTAQIDVTDKVVGFYMPLLAETKLEFIAAPSTYLEVRDQKIYLNAKAVTGTIVEKIQYTVTYKGVTIPSSLDVTITQ
jgi:hypothetical protein